MTEPYNSIQKMRDNETNFPPYKYTFRADAAFTILVYSRILEAVAQLKHN
jgi:hypothetical protein